MKIGDPVHFAPLGSLRVGSTCCNVQVLSRNPRIDHGFIARAAGTFCEILGKKGTDSVLLKLPSNKIITAPSSSTALPGRVGNESHRILSFIGKAGRNRWLGKRPKVRGEAMNPVDHPHGGKSSRSGGRGKPFKNI
jgi:large subunit ribosomal protein L2